MGAQSAGTLRVKGVGRQRGAQRPDGSCPRWAIEHPPWPLTAGLATFAGCAVDTDTIDSIAESSGGAGDEQTIADEPARPSNGTVTTTGNPQNLSVYASTGSGGTTNDIKLSYRNQSGTYWCVLYGGISAGETRSCVPIFYSSTSASDFDYFGVGLYGGAQTDGLSVGTIRWTDVDGTNHVRDQFDSNGGATDYACQSCTGVDGWYENCNICWVDGDDHGSVVDIKFEMYNSEDPGASNGALVSDEPDLANTIKVAHSGKYLEVANASFLDGAGIQQEATASGHDNQRFVLQYKFNNVYSIQGAQSGKCLEVKDSSSADGAVVQQSTCDNGMNQWFFPVYAGSGYVYLKAFHSLKCLGVKDSSTADGAILEQRTCADGSNQKFALSATTEDNLVPLLLFWNASRGDYLLTSTSAGEQSAVNDGYTFVRQEGWVYALPQPNTVPLYQFWNASRQDNLLTSDNIFAMINGYTLVRTEGYIHWTQQTGTSALKQYWSSSRQDYFAFSTSDSTYDAAVNGYTSARTEGYVLPP